MNHSRRGQLTDMDARIVELFKMSFEVVRNKAVLRKQIAAFRIHIPTIDDDLNLMLLSQL